VELYIYISIGIGKGKVPLAFLASLYPDHASIHQPMLLSQGVTPSSSTSSLGTPYTNKGFSQQTRHHDLKKSSSVLFGTPFEEKTSNHHHADLLVAYAPHSSTGSRKMEVRPATASYANGMVSTTSFQTPSSVLSPPLTSGEFRRVKENKQQSTPSSSSSSSSSSHKHEKEDKLISFEENELRMQKRSLRTLRKHILSQIELQNEVRELHKDREKERMESFGTLLLNIHM
jgi:hypothetical protein